MSRCTDERARMDEIPVEMHAAVMDINEPLTRESAFQNMKLEQELDPILGKMKDWVSERKLP